MVYNLKAPYRNGRTFDLMKIKDFFDDEGIIEDVTEGSGKNKGTAIFLVRLKNGEKIKITSVGSLEQRKEYFENAASYIGKALTYKYQNLTLDSKARIATMIAVRDYE